MKLAKMPKEQLELYSYIDLSKMILLEEKKPLNTPTMFKKICDLLNLSENAYAEKIGDYYTSLTTDKDFVLIDDGKWDLRDHHPVKVVLDEEEIEEESLEDEIEEEEVIEEEETNEITEDDLDDDDIDEEDTGDLTIIDEEELED
ncbi:MAG: DNA-directed RNA polymerase subunit delta [Bacilli bacterium]|nr:DNA-directed RNA polymerase subunit delta [Bacilli bacterium]